jgi:tetratricopeptide (TPR) repeat protein
MDLGLLLRAEKRNQEALQEYQNALAALDHVAKLQDSDEVDTARKTATTRSAIGRLKQGLKDTTGIADVEQALTGLEPLSRKFPKLQSLRATYIEVLQDLAEAYEDSGRIEDATRVMKRFQDWADANGAFFATSSEYEHVIPNGFSRSAGILAKAGKADAAIGAYERALLEYAKVKSPSQAFQINQIITRIFLADLFDGLGNTERKLSELRLAMQIAEKLIEKSDSVDPRVRYVDAAYRVFMETPSKPLAETINRHLGWLESRIDLSDYQEAKTQIRNYIDEN